MAIKILILFGHGTDEITKTFRSNFSDTEVEFFNYHSEDWKSDLESKVLQLDGVIINSTSNIVKASWILGDYNAFRSKSGKDNLPYEHTSHFHSVEDDCRVFIEELLALKLKVEKVH